MNYCLEINSKQNKKNNVSKIFFSEIFALKMFRSINATTVNFTSKKKV